MLQSHHIPRRLRRQSWTRLWVAAALITLFVQGAEQAQAVSFTVSTTTDKNDGICNADCSLREAIVSANSTPGPDTISVPAGIYQLSVSGNEDGATAGDLDITDPVTITGAGAGNTVIDGLDTDRVFDIAPILTCDTCSYDISGVTVTNGNANGNNFNVGGAIYLGSGSLTITDSEISSSTALGTGAGIEARGNLTLTRVNLHDNDAVAGGGAVRAAANLTVSASSLSNNEAEFGGGLSVSVGVGKAVSVTGTTFSANRAAATAGGADDNGGAIKIDNTQGSVTITRSVFVSNTSANNGGAIGVAGSSGPLSATYNRIAGNVALAGSGIFSDTSAVTATNNWWGCNAGPATAPCDRSVGSVTSSPWLVLTHSANPASIGSGGTSSLTASFLTNSAASPVAAADLAALVDLPVSFHSPVLGSLSNAQTAIQGTGTATATFTAGAAAGAGSASATVTAQTVVAPISITRPATTATSIVRGAPSPTSALSLPWTVTFADAVSGLNTANFTIATTGPISASVATVVPVGAEPATQWTVTAGSVTGTGTVGLNLTSDSGVSRSVSNLPVTGQTYDVDTTAPDTTITSNPTNPSNSTAAAFGFTSSDGGNPSTTFSCKLDATGFLPCASPANYVGLAQGTHTFQVRASDGVGNVDATPASFTWLVDSVAPETVINSTPQVRTNSSSATFGFAGNDSGGSGVASFQCSLDGGGVVVCSSPQVYVGLADGSHTFTVRANDSAGNIDNTPASYTWVIDTVAPAVTVEQAVGQTDPTNNSPVNFTVTFSEDMLPGTFSSIDVTVGGTANATTAVVTGGPRIFNAAVSGMTATGSVTASVAAGRAVDGAANPNTVSTSTDNTVQYIFNQAPSMQVTGGVCTSPTGPTGALTLSLSDPNGDPVTLTVVSTSNPSLLPLRSVVLSGTGNTRGLSVSAAAKKTGVAVITLRLNDGTVDVPLTINVVVGSDGNETLNGTEGVDMIFGLSGRNIINGLGGNDLLCGGNGVDTINGGAGNDFIDGQHGDDVLIGGPDNDTLRGGLGIDTLTGDSGADNFSGGAGVDIATDFNPGDGDTSDGTIP